MGLGFDISFQHELQHETWPLFGVGMFFIALRTFARVHRLGFRGLQIDDYMMLVAAGWYTILVVCLNVIVTGGGSNLFPLEQLPTFTKEDIRERIKGSKIVIVSEQGMLSVIYTVKTCMLIMYWRLTDGLRQQLFVKLIACYVACGWAASELAFFLACRPFHGYWAVPPPNPQCTTLQHYAITQGVFNISSDLLMLAVMIPLLIQIKLPWKQRAALVAIFSLGSFVIVAAICTKVFNLSDVYSTVYMLWYVRESSTAIYVSNIPMIWPLLREWFPYLKTLTPGQGTSKYKNSNKQHPTYLSNLSSKLKGSGMSSKMGNSSLIGRADSQERFNHGTELWSGKGILTETTVDVERDSVRNLDADIYDRRPTKQGWESPEQTPTRNHGDGFFSIIEASGKGRLDAQSYERHPR